MRTRSDKSVFSKGLALAAAGLLCVSSALAVEMKGELKTQDELFPLEAGKVQLSGFLEKDIQNSIAHWNKGVVPYPKLVEFFRTGRPQFALGEMWGKAVRSGCMFYRYTQDSELKRLMTATVKDLLSTERSNGSISCVPVEQQPDSGGGDLWERKYVLLALDEYYEQVEADPEVLASMIRQADCLIEQIGDAPKTPITELGWSPNHIESSTLLEPIMRLYKLTGYQRYLDFAQYIVRSGGSKGYNLFDQAFENVPPHQMGGPYPKAYEMTSLFEGLVEYYRATGDLRWKQTAMNLYNNVRLQEITIIGNGGGDQPYHPGVYGEAWDNTAVEQTNTDITRMMETCVGVTWMKFCSQLLRLEGDSTPVDDIEKYIYNGLLGAMKPSGDGFSYVNLLNGQKVTNQGWGWNFDGLPVTCCNLNGPMGLAYIPYIAVMRSAKGAAVNLYNAGKFETQTPSGRKLELEIVGDYPLSDKVIIKVQPQETEKFELALRIPGWSGHTVITGGGRKHIAAPGNYFRVNRKWKPGEQVEIQFQMSCCLLNAPMGSHPGSENFQAVAWGPIVLARDENMDANYDQPVTVLANKYGFVKAVRETPTLPGTRFEFTIPTAQGNIRMIDYASVNGWEGKKVCTWLPKAK
ncbi:MAG: glycoside hydrolase family 127 protein [Verrucomicrobia bacterium]|nr:glycoside hydrolase family 127 protein [Verrucomicrobiota bacterium]